MFWELEFFWSLTKVLRSRGRREGVRLGSSRFVFFRFLVSFGLSGIIDGFFRLSGLIFLYD